MGQFFTFEKIHSIFHRNTSTPFHLLTRLMRIKWKYFLDPTNAAERKQDFFFYKVCIFFAFAYKETGFCFILMYGS